MKKILQILGLLCLVGMLTMGPFLPTFFKMNKAQTVMQLNEEEVSKMQLVADEKDIPKILSLDIFANAFSEGISDAFFGQQHSFYPMLLYAVPTPPPDFI